MDEYLALTRYSELMKTCHNMNIIVKATGGYSYPLNGKTERTNKTLDYIKRDLLLKSSNNK